MKNIFLIIGISLFFNGSLYAQSDDWSPKNHNLIKSVREDGRFSSSYGVVHAMLRNTEPRYAFHVRVFRIFPDSSISTPLLRNFPLLFLIDEKPVVEGKLKLAYLSEVKRL